MPDNSSCLFCPQNLGPYEADLKNLFASLQQVDIQEDQLLVIQNYLQNLPFYQNSEENRLRYKTSLLVLNDLFHQQWEPDFRQGKLYLLPPNWAMKTTNENEAKERKAAIRRSLLWEREAQFEKKSVRKFIKRMEREHPFGDHLVSIRSLLADGEILSQKLRMIMEMSDNVEQLKQISIVIQPYLQLITPEERCTFTGFRLQDIWRYFRYTWSTPYNSTPGRQMFYLIRDAAQPFHPIIGIAALGSSMMQLTVRDNIIGWTPKSVNERINSSDFDDVQARSFVQMLRQTLKDVINDLAVGDLVSDAELVNPTQNTLQLLENIEKINKDQRITLLKQQHEEKPFEAVIQQPIQPSLIIFDDDSKNKKNNSHNYVNLAQEALYRTKRANVLRQLLHAQLNLQKASQTIETQEGLRKFNLSPDGQQTIKTLIRENKKRRIGINMMDIIVCGSVPPYNVLLGGKLVAMLLASPQIIYDYQHKYANYASKIASEMKGEEVIRDSELVFLGTTSLYASGSSQYNRITLPIEAQPQENMRYIRYGLTEGFGSVHFSSETVNAMNELQEYTQGARLINNRFGEGVNPKLRRIRTGLAAIGLTSAENFLRHRSQRIVYGLPLGRNCYAFLRGEVQDPEYYYNTTTDTERQEITHYICQYWARRWLMNRIKAIKYVDEVANFQSLNFLLSRDAHFSQVQNPQEVLEI